MTAKNKSVSADQALRPPNARRPPHLTAEQMEAMLRRSAYRKQASKHLDSCPDCRQEVDRLSEVLSQFRATSVLHAEKVQATTVTRERKTLLWRPAVFSWKWSIAAGALACTVATVPFFHFSTATTTAAPPSVVRSSGSAPSLEMSDQALLEGVQADLSAYVPAPLQLLAPPSADASSSVQSAGSTKSSRRPAVIPSR